MSLQHQGLNHANKIRKVVVAVAAVVIRGNNHKIHQTAKSRCRRRR
jgi:hypothetical protein